MATFREAFAEALRDNSSQMNGTGVYRVDGDGYIAISPLATEQGLRPEHDYEEIIAPIEYPDDWLGPNYDEMYPNGMTEEESLSEVDAIIENAGGEARFLAEREG